MSPADFLQSQPRLRRRLIRCCSQEAAWDSARSPGLRRETFAACHP